MSRASDKPCKKVYQRSNRLYQNSEKWFFTTREGIQCGPFDSSLEAEMGVRKFIWLQASISNSRQVETTTEKNYKVGFLRRYRKIKAKKNLN